MDKKVLQQIEQMLDYKCHDHNLLARAFTHSSSVDNRLHSNERLEFLGDSVLAIVICQALYEQFPNYLEGDLTKIKSMLVSRITCARLAKGLGLQEYLKVGKGMINSRSLSGSLAAGLLEAVIAVIYIDGGFEAARSFIIRCFADMIEQANREQTHDNFKSLLQQHAQQKFAVTPGYVLLDEKGPDHDKCFETQVLIQNRHFPSAWGTNKKEAEQKAAFNALVELGVIEQTYSDSDH